MGSSADATLFYGYAWHDESTSKSAILLPDPEVEEETDSCDWEDILAARLGLIDPHPKDADWSEWFEDPVNKTAMRAYWAEKKAAVDGYGVTFGYAGSAVDSVDYPYLYVKDSKRTIDWGILAVDLPDLLRLSEPSGEWFHKLEQFVDDFNVRLTVPHSYGDDDVAEGPGWHIAASYG